MAQFWLPGDSDFARSMRGWPTSPNERPPVKSKINRTNAFGASTEWVYLFDGYKPVQGSCNAGDVSYAQKHPSGHQGLVGQGAYCYADHGGSVDDRLRIEGLKARDALPSGSRKRTFIVDFTAESTGASAHTVFGDSMDRGLNNWGLYIQYTPGGTSDVGYLNGNGYQYFAVFNSGTGVGVGRNRVIVSMDQDSGTEAMTIWVNGKTIGNADSITGAVGHLDADSYVGDDTVLQTGSKGFTNYYHFKGTLHMVAAINGFYSQDQVNQLARDVYQIVEPANDAPFLISVPAGGGAPTLSSPGAINVLSDRATPQVTLTF